VIPLPLVSVTSSTVRPSGRVPNTVRVGSVARAGAGISPGIAAQAHSAMGPTPRIVSSPSVKPPVLPILRRLATGAAVDVRGTGIYSDK
jgi:hypothetical protein